VVAEALVGVFDWRVMAVSVLAQSGFFWVLLLLLKKPIAWAVNRSGILDEVFFNRMKGMEDALRRIEGEVFAQVALDERRPPIERARAAERCKAVGMNGVISAVYDQLARQIAESPELSYERDVESSMRKFGFRKEAEGGGG